MNDIFNDNWIVNFLNVIDIKLNKQNIILSQSITKSLIDKIIINTKSHTINNLKQYRKNGMIIYH